MIHTVMHKGKMAESRENLQKEKMKLVTDKMGKF